MRVGIRHTLGFGLTMVLALLAAAVNVQAQDLTSEPNRAEHQPSFTGPPELPVRCEVQVTEAVPISEEPVVVEATYSPTLGEALAAVLQKESGAQLVFAEIGTAEQSLLLTVDTSQALPGEWTLSLTAEGGVCTGTFIVAAAHKAAAS